MAFDLAMWVRHALRTTSSILTTLITEAAVMGVTKYVATKFPL